MRVLPEPPCSLAREASRFIANAVSAKPELTLALPTGRTPLGMYSELVRSHWDDGLDFSRVRIFNLDEYVGLSSSDERSFTHYLWTHFLHHVNVRPENVHLISTNACDSYEDEIRAAGGIDLLIAGIGSNGHIAFNEPGAPFDSRTRIVDLAESTIERMRAVFPSNELPTRAATVGIATILEARRILVLAAGDAKKRAVSAMIRGPISADNPASVLRLHPDVTVIVSNDAIE
jgi:glucosamine-6-phosphate deaminase